MGHIIALLRQVLQAVHDRELKNEVNVVQYSLLNDAIIFVLKLAYHIEHEESERSDLK